MKLIFYSILLFFPYNIVYLVCASSNSDSTNQTSSSWLDGNTEWETYDVAAVPKSSSSTSLLTDECNSSSTDDNRKSILRIPCSIRINTIDKEFEPIRTEISFNSSDNSSWISYDAIKQYGLQPFLKRKRLWNILQPKTILDEGTIILRLGGIITVPGPEFKVMNPPSFFSLVINRFFLRLQTQQQQSSKIFLGKQFLLTSLDAKLNIEDGTLDVMTIRTNNTHDNNNNNNENQSYSELVSITLIQSKEEESHKC